MVGMDKAGVVVGGAQDLPLKKQAGKGLVMSDLRKDVIARDCVKKTILILLEICIHLSNIATVKR